MKHREARARRGTPPRRRGAELRPQLSLHSRALPPAVLAALTGLAACQAADEAPRTEPAAPAVATQAAGLDPTPANSPYTSELVFVNGMGMVDGVTCESWPKDFRWDQPFPLGATPDDLQAGRATPALLGQLPGPLGYTQGAVLDRLVRTAQGMGVEGGAIVASKYGFELRRVPAPDGGEMVVALDRTTHVGFALSRRWLCTEAMAMDEACAPWLIDLEFSRKNLDPEADPQEPADTHYTILARAHAARVDGSLGRPLAVVSAPSVTQIDKFTLDADLLVVTDDYSAHGAMAVEATLAETSTWQDALTAVPEAPLVGIIADTLNSVDLRAYDTGGADGVTIAPAPASVGAPRRTLIDASEGTYASATVRPDDLFSAANTELETGAHEYRDRHILGEYFGEDAGYSTFRVEAKDVRFRRTEIRVAPRVAIRRGSGPTPEIFVACADGAACDSSRLDQGFGVYGAGPLRLDGVDLRSFVESTLAAQADPRVTTETCAAPPAVLATGGAYCRHNFDEDRYTLIQNGGATVVSHQACIDAIHAAPYATIPCHANTEVRFCLASQTGTILGCTTESDYRPNDPILIDRITRGLEDAVLNRLFGPQPYAPQLERRPIQSSDLALLDPTLPMALLASRGVLLDSLVWGEDDASLRSGVVDAPWVSLAERLAAELPRDPRTGSAYDLEDPALVAEALAIRSPARATLLSRAWQARVNARDELATNALSLPYGPVGGAWYQAPSQLGGSTFYLDAVRDRWQTMANDAEYMDTAIRLGNLQGGLQQYAAIGAGLAASTRAHADLQLKNLQDQAASVAATAARLGELRDGVAQQHADYVSTLGNIWGCDATLPSTDPGSCHEAMNRRLNSLLTVCVQASQQNRLMDFISLLGDFLSYLDTFLSVADFITGTLIPNAVDFLSTVPGAKVAFDEVAHFLEQAKQAANKAKELINSARKMSNYLNGLVDAAQQAPCDRGRPEYQAVAAHFTDMLTSTTLLDNLAIQTSELDTLVQRFSDDVRFLRTSQESYAELAEQMRALEAAYQGDAARSRDGVAQLRSLVQYACPLAQGALRASMGDLYRASQSLATTTGRAWSEPYMRVPASPGYAEPIASSTPGWRDAPVEHGFLISLWDARRFRRSLFDPQGIQQTLVDGLISRFDDFKLTEMCRVNLGYLPSGVVLVHKHLEGEALDAFFGKGKTTDRLRVALTLDDLVEAANGLAPNGHLGRLYDPVVAKAWMDRAPPVVLGVAYEVQRSSGARSLSPTGSWLGLGLTAPTTSYVPTTACPQPAASDVRVEEAGQALTLQTCVAPVQLPMAGSALLGSLGGRSPTDLAAQYVSGTGQSAAFCQVSSGLLVPDPIQGRPALGLWSISFDAISAAALGLQHHATPGTIEPTAAWRQANADVKSMDLYFVVGTELLAAGEAPAYLLTP
jgi:hypothetical protein